VTHVQDGDTTIEASEVERWEGTVWRYRIVTDRGLVHRAVTEQVALEVLEGEGYGRVSARGLLDAARKATTTSATLQRIDDLSCLRGTIGCSVEHVSGSEACETW
jgi:hypothetical protein